jgi:hypothetical protein
MWQAKDDLAMTAMTIDDRAASTATLPLMAAVNCQ